LTIAPCSGRQGVKLPHRRKFLHLAAGVAALPAMPYVAKAQAYPTRPVRLVVGYPPGGPSDIGSRLIAQALSDRLGQPFVVENRPGAGGNIGTEVVVKAPADGYTLLNANIPHAINATLYDNLTFDFIRDIAGVALIYRQPLVLEVNPSLPVRTVPEFIAYAKANPRTVNIASGGIGTPQHLALELFKRMAGRRAHSCVLSRLGARADRSHFWAGPGHARHHQLVDRAYQDWSTARSRRINDEAF
jgi:tripartite-type tricarboxylate transporter receptor subunit TctC